MCLTAGDTRKEVIACLTAINDSEDARALSKFGPADEEEGIIEAAQEMLDMPEDEREEYIIHKLQSLVAREEFSGLAEIHPAWLIDALSKESPRIIGIILRYLPSKQARHIIENLPKRIKTKLPQLIDSFAVPAPILKIIKTRFEKQFISYKLVKNYVEFGFKEISSLKSEEILVLFRDLGIHELAMSFKGVNRTSLNILFNRLSVFEARGLQQRIRSLTDVSPLLLRDARYTVLEMSLSEMNADDLLMDVGLNSFAKAISFEDSEMFALIKQKIEPRLAYTLRRYIDQHVDSNVGELADERKSLVLSRVQSLSRAGSINEEVASYFATPENVEDVIEAKEEEIKEEDIDVAEAPVADEGDSCYEDDGVI